MRIFVLSLKNVKKNFTIFNRLYKTAKNFSFYLRFLRAFFMRFYA